MKTTAPERTRLKATVRGAVQGVGFRPFIFRLATELGLAGWVKNNAQGVFLEVEGLRPDLERFLLHLESEKPPCSFIQSLEASWLDPVGLARFEIRGSDPDGARTALVLPDIATCPDCLWEIFDPQNRRYLYPFTNCTHCGPRFSIIESLPYDRGNTSMKHFVMCPECRAEYENPHNRRFHAQPNACPRCGPRLELRESRTGVSPVGRERGAQPGECGHAALVAAAAAIRDGKIVAVKGLGGFHLMVSAEDDQAVQRLRELKHREEKPFALMFPSLEAVRSVCEVSPLEERLLRSPEAPIVLLRRSEESQISNLKFPIAAGIAPGNPNLGVMLPYTPLHHLLLSLLQRPVVATSGNLSDEPICIDEHEAIERLGRIADLFLVHNRPIVRHVDDSIVRIVLGRELVLRRARGYAPLPVASGPHPPTLNPQAVLAVGAHLKNAVALSVGHQIFISQHIGDLETSQACEAFRRVIADFETLYETKPCLIAADVHPDYLSTKFARERLTEASLPARSPGTVAASQDAEQKNPASPQAGGLRCVSVQHHVAHVLSCMAENELESPVLGVSWDGTGYGLDGTIWGGEFFRLTDADAERFAHLRPFRLPGGDRAVKEPRRVALGLLYELLGDAAFEAKHLPPLRGLCSNELVTLKSMLERGLNSPFTSSAGRLFDAVSALTGLRQRIRFEGQAAMELEFTLEGIGTDETYPWPVAGEMADSQSRIAKTAASAGTSTASSLLAVSSPHRSTLECRPSTADSRSPTPDPRPSALLLDWSLTIRRVLADVEAGTAVPVISAKFHNTLAELIVRVARRCGEERVVLSGGCFQNRYLTERTVRRLRTEGFRPYWHQRVPPNDGGIALGQIIAAWRWAK